MFHLFEFLEAARPPTWTAPPKGGPTDLRLRYRRRNISVAPATAPNLSLPDAKFLGPLEAAAVASPLAEDVAATAIGACIDQPAIAVASSPNGTPECTWHLLSAIAGLDIVAWLSLRGEVRKRGAALASVELQCVDISDVESVRLLVEEIFQAADGAQDVIRDRGRKRAPRAMWIGLPPASPSSLTARLEAVAGVAGYVLKVVDDARSDARGVLRQAADVAPEFAIAWTPYVPPGDFVSRLRKSLLIDALVEGTDVDSFDKALNELRVWTNMAPALHRTPPSQTGPTTMAEGLVMARAKCNHLRFTNEADKSAKRSPYERPDEILAALCVLDRLAADFADGKLEGGRFETACAEAGLLFSADVSPEARQKHEARYTIVVSGHKRFLGPHLRFGGSWNPRFCARVYWWVDPEDKTLFVGHVGEHLPGKND